VQLVAAAAVRTQVRFEDLIEPVGQAFGDSTAGRAENGMLVLYPGHSRESGDILVKAGTVQGRDVCVVKIAPWFRVNVEQGAPQGGLIAVLDARTGRTLALIEDEHYLSDIRTAAAGALAGNFEFGADVAAVAITAAASASAGTAGASAGASGGEKDATTAGRYYKGVAVFTIVKGGAMYQATVAGQKFKYSPKRK
jgi:hypothetical protein